MALQAAGLDALWVTKPANVRYLSGFTSPEDATLLLSPQGSWLFTDGRYIAQAEAESRLPVFIGRGPEVFAKIGSLLPNKKVGFEADHISVETWGKLQEISGVKWHKSIGLVEKLRRVKTTTEIEYIRRAQNIAEEALKATLPRLQVGVQEIDIALEIEYQMRKRGAEGVGFDLIVASGYRSAMPHGLASHKRIEEGDLVTIDMGARYLGYHSDMTRAYPIGHISDRLLNMYRAVYEAQHLAVAAIKPGVACKDLDQLARDHLASYGFAEQFSHSLGHGVGLNIHEAPFFSKLSSDVLEAGMIVTVEPGVYFPGQGGVRLEDLLLVTETGYEILSVMPMEKL